MKSFMFRQVINMTVFISTEYLNYCPCGILKWNKGYLSLKSNEHFVINVGLFTVLFVFLCCGDCSWFCAFTSFKLKIEIRLWYTKYQWHLISLISTSLDFNYQVFNLFFTTEEKRAFVISLLYLDKVSYLMKCFWIQISF